MVRNRRKKALYEVIDKARYRPGYGKSVEKLHPDKSDAGRPPTGAALPKWPKRPRMVQLNADRIEISMPYQLAIALLLAVVLLVLVVFRLGQNWNPKADSAVKAPGIEQEAASGPIVEQVQVPEPAEKTAPVPVEETGPVKLKGNNRIVIQTYPLRTHLEPVKQYFADNGIEAEIRKIGGMYYLVTAEKYENPGRAGTDGHLAKQKIIELGARYKAPPGYETFGSKPFHDAYGMRFDD